MPTEPNTVPRDPICGRTLDGAPAANLSADYRRRRYYFCSEQCRHVFRARTERMHLIELARAGALLTPGGVRWGLS